MTLGKFRLTKQVKSLETRKPDELMEVPASLGLTIGGLRLVEIPNRPGYVYARIRDQLSEVVNVYNDQVSPIYDLPVIIVRHRTDMNRWRVKGRDLGRYSAWGSTAYLPNHGGQHSFDPTAAGGDIVWTYAQQIMPLAATPSGSSGAMNLIVKDFTYYRGNAWNYFPDTATASFVSYKPTGSNAAMVLLYLDTSDTLAYLKGTEFAITTGTANVIPNLPDQPADCFVPIAGIYLLSGTSALTWDNIYEARPFFTASVTGSTGGTSADIKAKVSADDTTTNYLENKIVAGAGVSITTLSPGGNETLSIAVTNTGSSGGVTDHGALTGLLDNDHPQYMLTGTAISGSGHIIQNEGTPLTARANLNFVGTGVNVTDDAGSDASDVTINLSTGTSFYPQFYPPQVSDFTWVNQDGTGTAVDSFTGIYMTAPANADREFRILKKAAPAVPYIIDAAILFQFFNVDNHTGGILFRDSASGTMHCYGIVNQWSAMITFKLWNEHLWNDTYTSSCNMMPINGVLYLRIEDNNVNRKCSWSTNGQDYMLFYEIARNNWFIADEVGIFIESQNATYSCGMTVLSWYEH